MLHISEKHNALVFGKSLYWVKDVILFPFTLKYVSICVTFQVDGEHDQTITSNYDDDNPDLPFREISASSKEMRIWGVKTDSTYVPIENKTKKNDWTNVFKSHTEHSCST